MSIGKFSISRMLLSSVLVALLTICGWINDVQCAVNIGITNNVINKVYGNTLLKTLQSGDRLFHNQRIRVGRDSSTEIQLLDDSVLFIGELSDLTLNSMVYNENKKTVTGALQIIKGILRFASGHAVQMAVNLETPHTVLGIRGTIFDVLSTRRQTELAVHQGTVQVDSPTGPKKVYAGQVYRILNTGQAHFTKSVSKRMQVSVSKMLRMLGVSGKLNSREAATRQVSKEGVELPSQTLPKEINAVKGKDLENMLYLDLTYGRVIIEMLPILAPNHVKRIKELVREKFFDGLSFHNVIAGFAAETGDPTGTGRSGSGQKLRAEISKLPFTRGIVGMKHDRNNLHNADSQFFILLGDAQHLEGKYTAWGRVIHGMLLMDRMRKGSPPHNPDRIVKMRVAEDVNK